MARHERVLEAYSRTMDAAEYTRIRELYKAHSLAENDRDLPGLIATLTTDCVYELPQSGHRWEGHDGAAQFYGELLGAFPDIVFDLRNIVIGPQGVWEEADVTGTWSEPWLGHPASRDQVEFVVHIFFSWDPAARLFGGERIYVDDPAMLSSAPPAR